MCSDQNVTYVPGCTLDALAAMAVVDETNLEQPRALLERIVSMLTGLIRP